MIQIRKEPEKKLLESEKVNSFFVFLNPSVKDSIVNESPTHPLVVPDKSDRKDYGGNSHQRLFFFPALLIQALIIKQMNYYNNLFTGFLAPNLTSNSFFTSSSVISLKHMSFSSLPCLVQCSCLILFK